MAIRIPMLPTMASWLVSKGVPCRLVALRVMGQARLMQFPTPPTRRLSSNHVTDPSVSSG